MEANGHANGHLKAAVIDTRADRLPPQNLEAERGVLAGIILEGKLIGDVAELLSPLDFYRDTHQVIFAAMLAIHQAGKPVDVIMLMEELERRNQLAEVGGWQGVGDIAESVPHAANCLYHAEIVAELARKRGLLEAAVQMIDDGYSTEYTASQIAEVAFNRISVIGSTRDDEEMSIESWPEPPDDRMYHGLTGWIVKTIEPHTEADSIAIALQFLVGFGSVIGRKAHWRVENDDHYSNLFLTLVGDSSKARKGTSWGRVKWMLGHADPTWIRDHLLSGFSSGEGIISIAKDADYQGGTLLSAGVDDKRILIMEAELAGMLKIMKRENNTLSARLRDAWDHGTLRIINKNSPMKCTNAHISVIAHITFDDLRSHLCATDMANGFANRFLWPCVKRSKELPEGGHLQDRDFDVLADKIREAVAFGQAGDWSGPVMKDPAAKNRWAEIYHDLSSTKPGLLGAIVNRAEAQVLRLALLYTILDLKYWIGVDHLEAALSAWDYCERSARFIWGDELGDPDSEKVLKALTQAGTAGLSAWTVRHQVLGGHRDKAQIQKIMTKLSRAGLIHSREEKTRGRPRVVFVGGGAPKAPKAPEGGGCRCQLSIGT